MREIYDDFEKIEPALRAQLTSRIGQDVRRRRRTRSIQIILDVLARHGLDPDHEHTQQLARVVAMLSSSPIYLDQIGAPRDQVLDDIAWAVRTLTGSVRGHTGTGAGRPDSADPTDETKPDDHD